MEVTRIAQKPDGNQRQTKSNENGYKLDSNQYEKTK
jgi:hypothetical protein